jgi:hypothetical protein
VVLGLFELDVEETTEDGVVDPCTVTESGDAANGEIVVRESARDRWSWAVDHAEAMANARDPATHRVLLRWVLQHRHGMPPPQG